MPDSSVEIAGDDHEYQSYMLIHRFHELSLDENHSSIFGNKACETVPPKSESAYLTKIRQDV